MNRNKKAKKKNEKNEKTKEENSLNFQSIKKIPEFCLLAVVVCLFVIEKYSIGIFYGISRTTIPKFIYVVVVNIHHQMLLLLLLLFVWLVVTIASFFLQHFSFLLLSFHFTSIHFTSCPFILFSIILAFPFGHIIQHLPYRRWWWWKKNKTIESCSVCVCPLHIRTI